MHGTPKSAVQAIVADCHPSLRAAQAKHRRIRQWDVVWKVFDLAVQWRALARRQEARLAAYEEARERPEATEADRDAMDNLIEQLRAADSPEVSTAGVVAPLLTEGNCPVTHTMQVAQMSET